MAHPTGWTLNPLTSTTRWDATEQQAHHRLVVRWRLVRRQAEWNPHVKTVQQDIAQAAPPRASPAARSDGSTTAR